VLIIQNISTIDKLITTGKTIIWLSTHILHQNNPLK